MVTRRASGSLFGLAYGDALGAQTEFLSAAEILARFPPDGPRHPPLDPSGVARVTDDTQMTLAVGEALLAADQHYSPATLEETLRAAFITWMDSPDNNRAPGMTCLRSCGGLARGLPWLRATDASSKGCGANMRVAPVGLLPARAGIVSGGAGAEGEAGVLAARSVSDVERAAIAQFQSALTHGHPTALASSDLTARAVFLLVTGVSPTALPRELRAYSESQRTVYHADYLGNLWQRPGVESPDAFIERGWEECLAVLDRLDAALAAPDMELDPCLATGEGWIAEEAFATGLLCFLLFPDDPVAALRRAAVTGGDSDSIACLTGAFAGACHGMDAWPAAWLQTIEYRDRLTALGIAWD
jgi:ADP-ribosylglycohydrolase